MTATPEWKEIISELIIDPGIVMIVGGADAGKTHFCAELANAGFAAGIPTAAVDADIGQSEIGAPGAIGMAMVNKEIEALSDLKPKRLHFIGATTPVAHMMECVAGAKRMVDAAADQGAKLIVLDTTGLIDGPLGRRLKTTKTDLIRPKYLIGLQKRREVDHLLAPFEKISTINVLRVKSSELARRKPPEYRTARRQHNFYNHFHDAPGHIIHLDEVSTWNTWLGTGKQMKWQYIKFMEDALKCRILHAEVTGKGIFAISERKCPDLRPLTEEFKTNAISIVTGDVFSNLLVGLADENANTLNVGLVQAIDFKQRFIFILSPMKTTSPVRVIQFGSMRVARDGKELGTVRQGEL